MSRGLNNGTAEPPSWVEPGRVVLAGGLGFLVPCAPKSHTNLTYSSVLEPTAPTAAFPYQILYRSKTMGSQLIGKFAKVAAAASATAAGYYAYRVYRNTTAIDTPIIASRSIPDSLRQSWTVKELINRNNHPAVMDSQYTELAARFREVPDKVLLARFLRGFFGGYVFGPERVALQAVGIDLVHMSS